MAKFDHRDEARAAKRVKESHFKTPKEESHFKTPNVKKSTRTVKIIAYEAILARFRTKNHELEVKRQNPSLQSMTK